MTERRKKKYKLRNLEVDRVDHVDRGANQHAEILFYKAQPDGGDLHIDGLIAAAKKKRRKMKPPTEDTMEKAFPFQQKKKPKPGEEEAPDPKAAAKPPAPGQQPPPGAPPGQPPATGNVQDLIEQARQKAQARPGAPAPSGQPPPGQPPAPGAQQPLTPGRPQPGSQPPAPGAAGRPGLPGAGAPPGAAGAPPGAGGLPGAKPNPFAKPGQPPVPGQPGANPFDMKEKQPPQFNFYFSEEGVGERLDDVLESVTKGMIESGVFIESATADDLRDMLPPATIEVIKNSLSAESANVKEGYMPIDKQALDPEVVEHIDHLDGQIAELTKALEDYVYTDEPVEDDTIEFEKAIADLPDEVVAVIKADRARAEEAEAELAAAAIAKADNEYIEKARAFDGVVDKPEEFGPMLRELAEANPEMAATVEKTLEAATERISKGGLFTEIGHVLPGTDGNAYERATSIAKGYVEAGEFKDIEEARAMVWERHGDLYDEYQEERSA